jgi:hypothetical protein
VLWQLVLLPITVTMPPCKLHTNSFTRSTLQIAELERALFVVQKLSGFVLSCRGAKLTLPAEGNFCWGRMMGS